MSALENLVAKILLDAEEKAKAIIFDTNTQAEKKIDREVRLATAQSEKIIADAHTQAQRSAQRLVQTQQLAARDELLTAQRQVLDDVLAQALHKLNNMPEQEFLQYLTQYLAKLDLDGETLILPKKYGITIRQVNDAQKKAGKKGNLTLDTSREIDGGFILVKGNIEQNHTFAALLHYYRDALESEALRILFE